jgi:hypothetical protein
MKDADRSGKPNRGPIKRILRHPLTKWGVILLVGYTSLLWVLGNLIDPRALRRELENQLELVLGTEVSIQRADPTIGYFGEWRLKLSGVTVENASPDIRGDLFTAEEIVLEDSLISLFRGSARPRIDVRGWALDLGLSGYGHTSLADIARPASSAPEGSQRWPLSLFAEAAQEAVLHRGTARIVDGTTGAALYEREVAGGMWGFVPGQNRVPTRLETELHGAQQGPGETFRVTASLLLPPLDDPRGSGEWWVAVTEETPVPLALAARLVGLNANGINTGTASGHVELGAGPNSPTPELREADLRVDGRPIPALALEPPFTLSLRPTRLGMELPQDKTSAMYEVRLRGLSSEKEITATLAAGKDTTDLRLTTPDFRLDALRGTLPSGDGSHGGLLRRLTRVDAEVEEWQMLGFAVHGARLYAELDEGVIERMAMRGRVCDGRVDFGAGGWPLGDPGWPRAIGLTIRRARAEELLPAIAHLLPARARLAPSSGRLSGLLFHIPRQTDPALILEEDLLQRLSLELVEPEAIDARRGWSASIMINEELRFDEPGANTVLQALWQLGADLHGGLPALLATPEASDSRPPGRLPHLRIVKGLFTVRKPPTGPMKMEGECVTRELGQVKLRYSPPETGEHGSILIRAFPLPADEPEIEKERVPFPQLPRRVRKAIALTQKDGGLQIRIPLPAGEQPAVWLYRQAIKKAHRTPAQDGGGAGNE